MTTVPITLQLSDTLVEQAQRFGTITNQGLEVVLSEALEVMGLTWDALSVESLPKPIAKLSDSEVLLLAQSKMPSVQNDRLGDLQERGKAEGLTEAEHYELMALFQIYQMGLLRKAAAIEEAYLRQLPLVLLGC
jgi:hypothetical protein